MRISPNRGSSSKTLILQQHNAKNGADGIAKNEVRTDILLERVVAPSAKVTTAESMVQFGDELRLEREQRGVSLETMCAATKLSQRQLLDVEAGNFRELPGGIFRKGFVRSYLRALDMDEPLWLERFEASYRASGFADSSDADWAHFAENVRNNRLGGKGSGFNRKWLGVCDGVFPAAARRLCLEVRDRPQTATSRSDCGHGVTAIRHAAIA